MNGMGMATGIGGVGLLLIGMYALSRLTGAVVRRIDLSPHRMKRLLGYSRLFAMAVGGTLSAVLYLRYLFLEPVVAALATENGWLVWAVGHSLGMVTVALGCVYAVQRGLEPAFGTLYDHDHTAPSHYRRRVWVANAFVVLGLSMSFLLPAVADAADVLIIVVVATVVFGWLAVRSPVATSALRTRDPTTEERERIDRCFDRFDRDAPTVVLFDDASEDLDVRLIGRRSVRTLWLQESLLADVTDDELAALLATEDEKNRRWFHERRFFSTCTALLLITALLFALMEDLSLLSSSGFIDASLRSVLTWLGVGGVTFVVLAAVNWRTKRIVYRADRFATARFDPELVRRMYDRYAETTTTIDHDQMTRDVQWKIAVEPSMPDRIRRIEREHDLEPMTSPAQADAEADDVSDEIDSSDEWTVDGADARESLERALESMDAGAFAELVADLRAEWDRECAVVASSDDPWIDVVATAEDGTRELLRTVHRSADDPVTTRAVLDGTGRVEYDGTADSVLVVTNGRFGESVRTLETDLRLVDGDRLVELLEETGLAARLETMTADESHVGGTSPAS